MKSALVLQIWAQSSSRHVRRLGVAAPFAQAVIEQGETGPVALLADLDATLGLLSVGLWHAKTSV